jgi:hypothetical protein
MNRINVLAVVDCLGNADYSGVNARNVSAKDTTSQTMRNEGKTYDYGDETANFTSPIRMR